jgi:hypothetical protein
MNGIPKDLVDSDAKAIFRGENPSVSVHPFLVRWFNVWNGSTNALLIGPSGVGKSITSAIAAETVFQFIIREVGKPSKILVSRTRPEGGFIRNVQVVRWIRADKLSRILSNRESIPEFDKLVAAPLLVIDDFGYGRFPEAALEVIGTRTELGRPIIATSGLTYDGIVQQQSEATARRLSSHKGALLVDCHQPAPSVRIAPSWPVVAPVTRHTATGSADGSSAPERALVANSEAAKRIRDFARGF